MIPLNRYTIGGAGLVIVLLFVFLQWGGAIAGWSAGVGRAIAGNQANIEQQRALELKLQEAQDANTQVKAEYAASRAALQEMAKQIADLRQQSSQAIASSRAKDQTIQQLEQSITARRLKASQRSKISTQAEALDALQAMGYR